MSGHVVDPFIRDLTADEPVIEWMGFEILHAHQGSAVVRLTVTVDQVNGNRVAHGGVAFAVADQAFAMAANTLIPYAATADAGIRYLSPTAVGDVLTATARTSYRDERSAVIDVDVESGGRTVALFRGSARAIRRT